MASELNKKWSEWNYIRYETKYMLHKIADNLAELHRGYWDTQYSIARTTLISDLVALGGILFSPFTSGLSLLATACASAAVFGPNLAGFIFSAEMPYACKTSIIVAREVLKLYESKTNEFFEILILIEMTQNEPIMYETVRDITKMLSKSRDELLKVNRSSREPCDAIEATANASHNIPADRVTLLLNAAKSLVKTAKELSAVVHGSDSAMLTALSVKEAIRTSALTRFATRTAPISILELTTTLIAIPLDLQKMLDIENSRLVTPKDVQMIREAADKLGDDAESWIISIGIFNPKDNEEFKMFDETHLEKLLELLEMCYNRYNI